MTVAEQKQYEQQWIAAHPGQNCNMAAAYVCLTVDEPVFIHPSSGLFAVDRQPAWLVYHELVCSATKRCVALQRHLFVQAQQLAAQTDRYSSLN